MPAWPIVVVLDTNVVIAWLLWEGPPRLLLARATEGDDLFLATSPIPGDGAQLLPIGMHGDISIISPRWCHYLLDSGGSARQWVDHPKKSFHEDRISRHWMDGQRLHASTAGAGAHGAGVEPLASVGEGPRGPRC